MYWNNSFLRMSKQTFPTQNFPQQPCTPSSGQSCGLGAGNNKRRCEQCFHFPSTPFTSCKWLLWSAHGVCGCECIHVALACCNWALHTLCIDLWLSLGDMCGFQKPCRVMDSVQFPELGDGEEVNRKGYASSSDCPESQCSQFLSSEVHSIVSFCPYQVPPYTRFVPIQLSSLVALWLSHVLWACTLPHHCLLSLL